MYQGKYKNLGKLLRYKSECLRNLRPVAYKLPAFYIAGGEKRRKNG